MRQTVTAGVEVPAPASPGPAAYVSDLAVELLNHLGCRYVPLNPGSSFRGLHDSLVNHGRNRAPQLLLCVHEEIAVSLAHGYAKAAGQVAVAAVHDLVGLMHASMAVFDAWCDRAPVLVLGGGGPAASRARRPIDWLHSAAAQAQLVRDYVKWDDEPADAQGMLNAIARGHMLAASPPRGPVYVTLDAELQEIAIPEGVALPDERVSRPAPGPAGDPDQVMAVARVLVSASEPVVVGGRVGLDPAATPLLIALVEQLGAAYRDDRNVVAFPTGHPHNLSGDPAVLGRADAVLAVDLADLASVRRTPSSRDRASDRASDPGHPGDPGDQRGVSNDRDGRLAPQVGGDDQRGVKSDHDGRISPQWLTAITLDPLAPSGWANAGQAPVPADLLVVADATTALRQLHDAVSDLLSAEPVANRRRREERRADIAWRHEQLRERQRRAADATSRRVPIAPAWLSTCVWRAVHDRSWLLTVRNTRTWPEGVWQFPGAGSYLGHSGGAGVGYGPGATVGGALAARDRGQLAVAIIGDGDLLMAPGALWTAVHYEIPLLMVVNNNRSFFNDEEHQTAVARQRRRPEANAWIGMRLDQPAVDFAALAHTYGAWAGKPVTHPHALPGALDAALAAVDDGRVALVDVHTAGA